MEELDETVVPVELKYCERCGGLWFRSISEGRAAKRAFSFWRRLRDRFSGHESESAWEPVSKQS